ncbi:LmeA family phospholipid-binding protein [Actinotalea ferrariae]|uniref:LmeA family phospholipid-binding protein n=1 Tax=Actinotalea ferrariae TaxID=1386098 RepID=UPI001C8BFEAE|nr:LmeA family phospholipid-binding protein [Actinotalea ferrariae]MBX9246308.1 LmeA family phospholipid-binding protein [Actinotalea ferrariae]
MERQRVKDGLVGAGITVLVLVLAVVVLLWAVTEPAGDAEAAPVPGPTASPGQPDPTPPDDLEAGEIWLTGLELDAVTVATPDGALHDVRAVGRDVRTGPEGLVAGELDVDATVPFALVASQIAEDVVVTAGPDGLASVVRTVELGGRDLRVEATGSVEVRSGRLVVEPQTIDVGGPSFLAGVLGAVARRLVTIEHEIEGLPDGLVLREVTVEDDGFHAELSGQDVRLETQPTG